MAFMHIFPTETTKKITFFPICRFARYAVVKNGLVRNCKDFTQEGKDMSCRPV